MDSRTRDFHCIIERYTVAGSLWDNMVPFWVKEMNGYITPDPNSNPIIYYLKWTVVGEYGSTGKNMKTKQTPYLAWVDLYFL